MATEIEATIILPNHDEIVKIIETRMHLVQADEQLEELLLQYIKNVCVYKAMNATGKKIEEILEKGEPWPKDLFPAIKERTANLQSEYEMLIGRLAPCEEAHEGNREGGTSGDTAQQSKATPRPST